MSEKMVSQNKLYEIKSVPYNKPRNNPIWGLVSIEVGLDGHLICLSCCFSCHSDMFIKYGALGWVLKKYARRYLYLTF